MSFIKKKKTPILNEYFMSNTFFHRPNIKDLDVTFYKKT